MTCRELERLDLEGAAAEARDAHRAICRACERLGADIEAAAELVAGLAPPRWTGSLREALLEIPRRTASCSLAPDLMALAAEGELPSGDQARLASHLSRCEGCSEAAATLKVLPDLTAAAPAPWLFGRIVANRAPQKSAWRRLLTARAVVAYAYAAAVVVMIAGLNPADLARRAGVGLEANTREAVELAGSSLADRFGRFQEAAMRRLAVIKGHANGYGRAALFNALALVMREEGPAGRRAQPSGGENIPKGNQTQMMTWRA
ncbi:MAG: hypothetical protein ABR576_04115 [Thermoanaerobaculia bacterium]